MVECTGLENQQGLVALRGFKSHPLRHFCFLGILLSALSSSAAADARVTGSYFAVIVSDIDVSQEWYESVLNLQVGTRFTEEGRYDVVNLYGPGLFVELLELSAAEARPDGFVKGAFKVGMLVDDIDAFVRGLSGTIDQPEILHDENNKLVMLQLRDPDDQIVQVMQILPADSGMR